MIKSFLILIIFPIFLFSSQEIILVVADDFNSTHASLECYDDAKKVFSTKVNLGKNGLGWGLGEVKLSQNSHDPIKYEGDKKVPIGVFRLTDIFGYAFKSNYKLPYLHTSKGLICVDDSDSNFYNTIIERIGDEKSFEYMKREDQQYKFGVVIAHNSKALKKRGSCIFLHIQREAKASTVGCTSMQEKDLKFIIHWLDKKKNPLLVQIPKSTAKEIKKLYPQLRSSKLLN